MNEAAVDTPEATIVSDICVVGAGPAGLALVAELIHTGLRITVLESGVDEQSAADELSELEFASLHFPSPEGTLRRRVGGMVPDWNSTLIDGTPAARYLPFDSIDFERRFWIPNSGWPITIEDLQPYYRRARTMCGLEAFDGRTQLIASGFHALPSRSGTLTTRLDQLAPASVFTPDLVTRIRAAQNVQLLTNATAVSIRQHRSGLNDLAEVAVARRGGGSFVVRSARVVLAGGAIQSSRLLLSSTADQPNGFGNQFDNVGRYFMDHPRISFGNGSFANSNSWRLLQLYTQHRIGSSEFLGKLKLSEERLRSERLLSGNAQISPHPFSLRQLSGVRSGRRVATTLRSRQALSSLPSDVLGILRESVPLAAAALSMRRRRQPGEVPRSSTYIFESAQSFKLQYQPEQAPDRGNRVTLADRRDSLGMRLARLDWRWSNIDLESIHRVRQIFADEIRQSGLGSMESMNSELLPVGELNGQPVTAHHHLGTTRMHDDPRHGVVDRNCRIHGSGSVFVAGGSVFPTGGYANPTLTIVALSIRLADYLQDSFRSST